VFVYLSLVKPRLAPARRAGFPLGGSRTQFTFRIDRWDCDGCPIMDHIAGSEDLMVAMAAYEAACRHWPGETITLRQGAKVIEDSRKGGLA
jgi:hypothetical protein